MADESVYAGARPLWMSLPGINALIEALNSSPDNLTGNRIGEGLPPTINSQGESARGYGQSRATPEELIAMATRQGAGSPPPAGGRQIASAGMTRGGAGGGIGMKELQALMDQITASGVAKRGVMLDAAGKMKMPETAKDAEAYLRAQKETPVEKGDWWKPVAQAIAGGLVDPNSNNPFGEFGKRATAAFTSDEAARKADRDKKLLEKVTGIKFGATDRASRDKFSEAQNAQTGAIASAEMAPATAAAEAAGKAIPQVAEFGKLAETRRHNQSVEGRMPKGSEEQVRRIMQLIASPNEEDKKVGMTMLQQMKSAVPTKFDDKQVEFAQQGVTSLLAGVKDPEKRKQLLAAWQQDVLETKDPVVSTRKLMQVINAPVGK